MPKLVVLPESPLAHALMRSLEEASIEAMCSREQSVGQVIIGGQHNVSIWIAEKRDMQRAAEILRALQALETTDECPQCGYDMQGHDGPTACPECGHELTTPPAEAPCPQCGEAVPVDFEVCWSCGAETPVRSNGP